MSQTNELISDLLSLYKDKDSEDTYLQGRVQVPGWMVNLPFEQSDKLIMPELVKVFPEIAGRWELDVLSELSDTKVKSFYCLKRYDFPTQTELLLNTYSRQELEELGYDFDD